MVLSEEGMHDDGAGEAFLLEIQDVCVIFMYMDREGNLAAFAREYEGLRQRR